jgi:hypothetical protein
MDGTNSHILYYYAVTSAVCCRIFVLRFIPLMEMSRAARTVNVWLKLLRVDDQLLHFKTLELGGYLLAQRALHICVSELSTESVLYIYI